MKKLSILLIIIFIIVLLLATTFFYNFLYFKSFNKKVRPISDLEKKEILEIINKSMNIDKYDVKFGNIYIINNREIAQIELIHNNSKKDYLVDINTKRLVKK